MHAGGRSSFRAVAERKEASIDLKLYGSWVEPGGSCIDENGYVSLKTRVDQSGSMRKARRVRRQEDPRQSSRLRTPMCAL